MSRASSTSLVHDGEAGGDERFAYYTAAGGGTAAASVSVSTNASAADDELSPVNSRYGGGAGFGSRFGSRAASARNSRRGSRVGSRAEMGMTGMTPMGARTPVAALPGMEGRDEYFGESAVVASGGPVTPIEPDFVEGQNLEEEEEYIMGQLAEEEVRRLAAQRGFGLGGLMDRLIGWSLFRVEEDGEETDDDDEVEDTDEAERKASSVRQIEPPARKVEVPPPPGEQGEGEGGWKDAAWLLSVASKVML